MMFEVRGHCEINGEIWNYYELLFWFNDFRFYRRNFFSVFIYVNIKSSLLYKRYMFMEQYYIQLKNKCIILADTEI